MSNSKGNLPDTWERYLENMIDEDLEGIENPSALAHLGVLFSNEYENHVRKYCDYCQQNSLRGFWFAKRPRYEEIHINIS